MLHIAFIGAGNLAHSLIKGLYSDDYLLCVTDTCEEQLKTLCAEFPTVQAYTNSTDMVEDCDVVLLCVKPDDVRSVCKEISGHLKQTIVISVAAGVDLQMLKHWLEDNGTDILFRCMPNLAVAVRQGMNVLCAASNASTEQRRIVELIFANVGATAWIDESMMDYVTALSGSGPAYFFRIMQALERAAKAYGMDSHLAQQLVRQTALGAATFAHANSDSLQVLCEKVAAKGGTTERALNILEQEQIDYIFKQALDEAAQRAHEISETLAKD